MAYQWNPSYSSFIDTAANPNAVWRNATEGGGSEGAPGTQAGWYNYQQGGNSGDSGYTPDSYSYISPSEGSWDTGVNSPDYWKMKQAGLWNLSDPNSDTWKYLQNYGGGGDVRTDPNAFANALKTGGGLGQAAWSRDAQGRSQIEGAYKDAMSGMNPDFVNQLSSAMGQNAEDYWTTSKQAENQGIMKDIGDGMGVYRDMITQTPLGAALAAMTGGLLSPMMGGGAVGAAGAGATIGGGYSALNGGNLGDIAKGAGMGALGGAAGNAVFGGTGTGTAGMPVGPNGMEAGGGFGSTFQSDPGLVGNSPFMSGLDSSAIAGMDFSGVPMASLSGGPQTSGVMGGGSPLVSQTVGGDQPFSLDNNIGGGGMDMPGVGQIPQATPQTTPPADFNPGGGLDLQGMGSGSGFTTNPGLDQLGGNMDPSTGFPSAGAPLGEGNGFPGQPGMGVPAASGTPGPTGGLPSIGGSMDQSGSLSGPGLAGAGVAGAGLAGSGMGDGTVFDGSTGLNNQGSPSGLGALGSALGGIPLGNVVGAGAGMWSAQQLMDALKQMQKTAIDSDLWRTQQGRYNEPLYDAATKGIGNTAYGQSIASDTSRAMSAQGYNMSGNQQHEVAQGLNRGSMDYMKALTPLAMGRGAVSDGSGYTSGMVQGNSMFQNALGTGLGSIFNQQGQQAAGNQGPTLGQVGTSLQHMFSL